MVKKNIICGHRTFRSLCLKSLIRHLYGTVVDSDSVVFVLIKLVNQLSFFLFTKTPTTNIMFLSSNLF